MPVAAGFPSAGDWPLLTKVARNSPNGQRSGVVFAENDLGANRMQLHAAFWDGSSWINGIGGANGTFQSFGNSADVSPVVSRYFDAAYEQQSGDFLVVTGTNTDEAVDIYLHSGSSWSANLSGTPAGNGTMLDQGEVGAMSFRWVRLEPRPASNQIAFIGLAHDPTQTSGVVHAAIWDGDTNSFGSKAILSLPITDGQNANPGDAIDIDYVLAGANAGEALAVWGNQTELRRRIWNPGTGWGASASVQDLGVGNTLRWIRQKAAPNSDDMILAMGDVNERIYTIRYDGNTRAFASFSSVPHSTTAFGNADQNRPFDVAWDPSSGPNTVLLVYSDTTGIKYKVSGNGGGLWTLEQTLDLSFQAHWVQLERDPSNVVHLVIKDQTNDLACLVLARRGPGPRRRRCRRRPTSRPTAPTRTPRASRSRPTRPPGLPRPSSCSRSTPSGWTAPSSSPGRPARSSTTRASTSTADRQPTAPGRASPRRSSRASARRRSARATAWRDSGLVNGQRYYYRLEDVDTRSKSTFHGPVSAVPAAGGS